MICQLCEHTKEWHLGINGECVHPKCFNPHYPMLGRDENDQDSIVFIEVYWCEAFECKEAVTT